MTVPVISPRNWPLKAYKNLPFLNSNPARNIRMLCEMAERGLRFAVQNIEDTIVLFGSARTKAIAVAEKELTAAHAKIKDPENLTAQENKASIKRSAPSNLRPTMMRRCDYTSR